MKNSKVKQLLAFFILLMSAFGALLSYAEPITLKIRLGGGETLATVEQCYYVQLLHKALVRGAEGRDIQIPVFKFVPFMEQGRAMNELMRGELLDVDWFGTDIEREKNLLAIRIPLARGLLGYRQFIIHRDNREKFDQIKSIDDLKHFVGCQGLNWPDSKILQSAGLRITELSGFDTLFKQVEAKRCDYFPRAYSEVDRELKLQKEYKNLIKYDSIMLHYPFAMYFFVNKKNVYLARWIERGLEAMIDNGELLAHMKRHPEMGHLFPLATSKNTLWFNIKNPFLSADTHYKNPRYWFQPSDFLVTKSAKPAAKSKNK